MPASDPKAPKRLNPKGWWKQWRKQKKEKRKEDKSDSKHSDIEAKVMHIIASSSFLRKSEICRPIALLERGEVHVGRLLGEGSFCEAIEVTAFKLRDREISEAKDSSLSSNCCSKVIDESTEACRQQLQRRAKLHGRPRYALKQLSINLFLMQGNTKEAAVDLVIEANYLMRFDHPHILKIRGMALGGPAAFDKRCFDGFFVVMDRLDGTLQDRIRQWRKKKYYEQTLYRKSTVAKKAKDALQIASALTYLHRQRIIFRDCKPHNVGFKYEGGHETLQLFDFGFCREIPKASSEEGSGDDEVFLMSRVGSPHYMAPEVLFDKSEYNLKADVYSFAVTFYEMLTLKRMGECVSNLDSLKKTSAMGKRPNLSKAGLPSSIKDLLGKGWSQSVAERASMQQMYGDLEDIIQELEQSIPEELEDDSSEPSSPVSVKKVSVASNSRPVRKKLQGLFRRSFVSEETQQTSGFLSHTSSMSFNSEAVHFF